ncbi:hypothetical protein ACW2QC_14130 [Virgibacillus sp. FSP13]
MLATSSINELLCAQREIENFKMAKPALFQKFMNAIHLTRQLQYGFQYLGCLILDENPSEFRPDAQDDYVLSVYQQEIEKLKEDSKAHDLKQLLSTYQQIGYGKICKLALGINPKVLVGPAVVR